MTMTTPLTGIEVYRSKEFKDLCKLLDIAWGLPTKSIVITLELDEPATVSIDQQYVAGMQDPDRPVFVDDRK